MRPFSKAWAVKPPPGTRIDFGNPLARGLTGCWLFNEGAGAVVRDIAGQRHGSVSGGLGSDLVWTPGDYGITLKSVGSTNTSRITIPSLTTGSVWTWETRLLATTFTDSWEALFTQGSSLGLFARSSGLIRIEAGTGLYSNSSLSAGTRYHVVATSDGSTLRIFINGKEDASGTAGTPTFNADTMFNDSASETFDGRMEYQRFWNRALSQSEILQLSARPFSIFVAPHRLWIPVAAASGGGITADLAVTEGDDTLASAATILVTAAASITEGADTLSSAATVLVTAGASITEGDDTSSAAATILVTANSSITEGADTLSSATTILVTINSAITEGDDTLVSVLSDGGFSASITEGDDSAFSAATVLVTATSSITEGADTSSSATTVLVTAGASITEGSDTVVSSLSSLVWTSYGTIFLYTESNWQGREFFFEAVFRASTGTVKSRLVDSAGNEVSGSLLSTTSSTMTRQRAAVALVDGEEYQAQFGRGASDVGYFLGASLVAI